MSQLEVFIDLEIHTEPSPKKISLKLRIILVYFIMIMIFMMAIVNQENSLRETFAMMNPYLICTRTNSF